MSSDPTGEFHRIRRLPPYVFAEVNTAKAKARVAGEDIIDLGMGNPDSPTPPHVVAKLVEAVQDPRTHRYSVSKGIPGLRRALAGYYQRRFDVGLDPEIPSNPTAYLADLDFYREIVAFARRHEVWIMSDLAYAEIYFGDTPPPSLLQVPGAKESAVEFTSLSKTYSMPGWRMGFAAGNPRLINALTRMKSYLDYGAFTPIQVAAAAALNGPQDCVDQIRTLYRERRDVVIRGLASAGWEVPSPEGSMFAWAPIPPRFSGLGSVEFSKLLLARAKVAVSPGLGFGEHGEGYVRIALVENTHRLRQAVRNIRAFMQAGTNQAALSDAAIS
jgi:aspartate/methionine/tyrosine aminotransferase